MSDTSEFVARIHKAELAIHEILHQLEVDGAQVRGIELFRVPYRGQSEQVEDVPVVRLTVFPVRY